MSDHPPDRPPPPGDPNQGMVVSRAAVEAQVELVGSQVRASLDKQLVVAFLGSASSGKDSAIRALFGVDFGQIDPIPGSTDRVRVARMDSGGHVLVANAPGFGDLRDSVESAARGVLQHLDLAVYIVNSDGGATIDERRDLDQIRSLGRPVLVCLNKIDLIRPHQREAFIRTTLVQLGVDAQDAVVTAFDPLPALADEPIGLDAVIAWIHGKLEEDGKALLFAKQLRNKAAACEVIIQAAARRAAMAGAIPVPGADMAAVTAVQVKLISDIAAIHEIRLDKDIAMFILAEALAGTGKGFVRWALEALKAGGYVPGGAIAEVAASALGATVAGASTYGVGKAAVAYMARGSVIRGDELRRVFDAEAMSYRETRSSTDPRWDADLRRAREELPLEELLRRCHRDELLPLAREVRVNPEGLGTGKLGQVCAWTLRRAGGHELANLVRGGKGPGYPQVLRELAERLGTTAQPTLERTELAVMQAWLHKAHEELSEEQRAELEQTFGPVLHPAGGPTSLERRVSRVAAPARDAGMMVAGGALRLAPLFVPFLAPISLVAGMWWLGRPRDKILLPAVLEVTRLRQVVRHRVTVGVVGSPSSGKDAAIKAIFGMDTGNVHPIAGSTRAVTITRLPGASALFIVNTPGMGDMVESVTEQARQILHHIDVFVYIVNAQGGVQTRELADYRTCLSTGRPVLAVINKIDTIRERDRARYLDDARSKLSAPTENFLAAAFDPLPQLYPAPLGLEPVQDWITHHLAELGKDPTELPWVPTELDADVLPPGATCVEEAPVPDGPWITPVPTVVPEPGAVD